jgi:hypothetical protein
VSDVAAVALISSGSSLIAASIGALTTYKVSLRNAETTVATAEAQKEVELAKLGGEIERLQQGNREDERRNRQSTYHQHLNALIKFFQLMGTTASGDQIAPIRDEYMYLHAGVVLFAPPSVREAAQEVARLYNQIAPAVEKQREDHPDKPEPERWRDATATLKEPLSDSIGNLMAVMHADVTRGIAEDPRRPED